MNKTLTLFAVMFLALLNTGCPGGKKKEAAPKKKQAVEVGPGGKNVKPGQGPNGGNNNGVKPNGGNEGTKTLAKKVEACVKKILVKGTPASDVKSLFEKLETLIKDNPGAVDGVVMKVLGPLNTMKFEGDDTCLHMAIRSRAVATVKALLKVQGINVNAKNKYGQPPLHLTVENNNEDGLKALLDAGADVNAKDKYGQTTLHLAVRHGREILVNALLGDEYIQVNAQDEDGRTPLTLLYKFSVNHFYLPTKNTVTEDNYRRAYNIATTLLEHGGMR